MRSVFLLLLLALNLGLVRAQERPPCVFCQIAKGEGEASVIYRDAKLAAFMDYAPVNPGHALIVPVEHAQELADLPADTAREMMALAQRIAAALKQSGVRAEGIQLEMNNGAPIQRMKHAHLHVIPRYADDPREKQGLTQPRDRAERSELNRIAARIKRSLDLVDLFDRYHEERLKLFPLEATEAGDNRYNHLLPNTISEEYRAEVKEFYRKYLDGVRAVDREGLSDSERTSCETLEWECEVNLAQLEYPTHLLPINQFDSMHRAIAVWAGGTSAQPFKTARDYENWLGRLEGFSKWCDTGIENMRAGIAAGHVLPKTLTVKVLPQLLKMATGPVEEHLFYTPIKNMPAEIEEADRERLAAAYREMIGEKIIPRFAEMHAFMMADYLPASRESSGISAIPNGKEYYDLQIKIYTTTEMTADEVHDLGQREVKRILAEMEKVKREVGFRGNIREFFDHVRTKKELMPFSDPQQVIENFNAIHEKMKPSLARLFNLVPKTAFEVRRTEAFREASAAAQYMVGTLDGSRPGVFYVPIPDVKTYNVFADEALFLHEAIPGHHYQISLQREDASLPQFRRLLWYSAYGEGWALYCESLGKELGLYDDPYQYFGMLSMEMHRAIRLVVDTGMHAKGWTREQAIEFSLNHEAESEDGIIAEIERYMSWPGQALSYKVGQLSIRMLRARAEKELGERFDPREFHDQVLMPGCVPLKVLERRIADWVEGKKSGK